MNEAERANNCCMNEATAVADYWTLDSQPPVLRNLPSGAEKQLPAIRLSVVVWSFLILTGLLWACPVQGKERELVQVSPAQIGLSEEALGEVTSYLQGEVNAGRIGAAVGMIARHGKIGYFESVGDCEKDSLFRLASMTKAITSVAVMQLVEAGGIQLNDPISRYLPGFKSLKVISADGSEADLTKEPTIHHLLTHTSGIGYGWWGGPQDEAYIAAGVHDLLIPNQDTLEEHTDKLAKLPLAFEPGTQWMYGQSLDVLGRVVEMVSGLDLERYFYERIFRPLKMKDTRFYLNEKQQKNLVTLYSPGENGGLVEVSDKALSAGAINYAADLNYEGRGNLYAGGSGLAGSTPDYARFLQMLLNKGSLEGVRILKTATVDLMTRNQIGELAMPFPGHGDGFGYGFGVLTEKGKAVDVASVGTYSWGGIFNTYYWVDPQEELIGLVMMQIFPNDHLPIREGFKQRVYQAIDDSGFSRRYWYEEGLEHGNPHFNQRQLRVNAPFASVHPIFAERSEPRSSGLARILIEEDLRSIAGAGLYCEIWGGHPGTYDKRFSVNGRSLFQIPETGSAANNCTHGYPRFTLSPTDLVNGYNSLQFACEKEDTGWGHFIVENVALDIHLPRNHSDLTAAGLDSFSSTVSATGSAESDMIQFELISSNLKPISKVVYQAHYYGYDENGNGWETDWHGMTKEREPYGVVGQAEVPPFKVDWDVSMIPAQTGIEVRSLVYFRDYPRMIYQTDSLRGVEIPKRDNARVSLHTSKDLPKPFWSRVDRVKECAIQLDVDPAHIDKAELHVVAWTGGPGEVEEYFTLNGKALPVAEGSGHETVYSVLSLDPQDLRFGENRIKLVSGTHHHGIEILLPGPALMIRSQSQ